MIEHRPSTKPFTDKIETDATIPLHPFAREPMTEARCVYHPDRPVRANLDGDDLCQECCDAWARGEGEAANQEDPGHG